MVDSHAAERAAESRRSERWGDFREYPAFDTHNQIITDDAATSRGAFQLLVELCAIDVPALLTRGAQRGASARRLCASREAEGTAADRAD